MAGSDLGLGTQLRTAQKVLGFVGHFVLRASGSHNQGKNCFRTNISDTSECHEVNKLGRYFSGPGARHVPWEILLNQEFCIET